jgi:hypothetical protein
MTGDVSAHSTDWRPRPSEDQFRKEAGALRWRAGGIAEEGEQRASEDGNSDDQRVCECRAEPGHRQAIGNAARSPQESPGNASIFLDAFPAAVYRKNGKCEVAP